MRVVITADAVGGVWQYALDLCRGLTAHDVDITLAVLSPSASNGSGSACSADQRAEAEAVPGLRLREHTGRLEWMTDSAADVARAGDWLRDVVDEARPDLVHFNHYTHAALPWSMPTLIVGHSCVLSWWEAVKGERAPAAWRHYQQQVQRGLQAARTVIAPSRALLDTLQRHYGPLPAPRVIPNGRDARAFAPGVKEPFVFAAGRLWDDAKNLGALDAIAGDLPWPVCIAGDTRHPDGGAARARHAQLIGRLPSNEIAGWMSRAAIYAWPARYEPFGLTVVEAALSGCALVLGDISSLREIWQDAALFVPPTDHRALRDALHMLIASPTLRETLAHACRTRALELSTTRMVDGYLAAYAEVIAAAATTSVPAIRRAAAVGRDRRP